MLKILWGLVCGSSLKKGGESLKIVLKKLGHFWLDSGLVGFIKTVEEIKDNYNVKTKLLDNSFEMEGKEEELQSFLEKNYEILVDNFYNISTQKQKENKANYNFYYDTIRGEFIPVPKTKSRGIAEVIYDTAPRPSEEAYKWKDKYKIDVEINGKKKKLERGILPNRFSHLQEKLDNYLNENNLSITSKFLVNGSFRVSPKLKIKIKGRRKKGSCFICGEASYSFQNINQTVYPLITGTSGVLSFYSNANKPDKVCWKCAMLGKYVPKNGFYISQNNNKFIFLPYSESLKKMIDVYSPLHDAEYIDPNYYRNFELEISYISHIFEASFSFLYTLYKKVLVTSQSNEELVFMEKLFDIFIDKTPVEFYILHATKEGKSYQFKLVWPFKETSYFFRLLNKLENDGIIITEVMRLLINNKEKKAENKTLIRNKICERILKKQSVLDLVEKYVYKTQQRYIKPLLDFLMVYEVIIKKEDKMTKEEREVAVRLGKQIGMFVSKNDEGKKGDLFALRKARRKVDFLEQLNRLQFKYGNGFIIPSDVYNGKLTDDNFNEFKQFCMVAALNSFNAAQSNNEEVEK